MTNYKEMDTRKNEKSYKNKPEIRNKNKNTFKSVRNVEIK